MDPAIPRLATPRVASQPRGALRRDSVKKNVAAIHVSGKLTLLQRKLSNVLLLNAYDGLLSRRSHRVDARTLCSMIGYNSNDMDTLKDALRALVETTAEWDLLGDDGVQEWGVSALLASARLRGGVCEYAYSPALAEKLHDPKIFALINLSIQRQFNSGHALTLYENCFRFVRTGSTGWWDLAVFRQLMGVDDSDYYAVFKHLNAKIIKPAVAEVNAVSNIHLTAEMRRTGRTVSALRFLIRETGQGPLVEHDMAGSVVDDAKAPVCGIDVDDAALRARLAALGVSERLARRWLDEHGAAYVAEKLDYVQAEARRGRVRGSGVGYLSAALRDDYRGPGSAARQGSAAGQGPAAGQGAVAGQGPAAADPATGARNRAAGTLAAGDAAEALAALKRSHRAACFDAVEALVSRRNPTQRDADRRQFLGMIQNEIEREDFRARAWRSAVNGAAIFAFWRGIAPQALPTLEGMAAERGVDLAALQAAAADQG